MLDIAPLKDSIRSVTAYRLKLIGLDKALSDRDQTSWRPLQHDEEWMYMTERDTKVCPEHCRPLESTIWRGDYIPYKFIYFEFLSALVIEPNMHNLCRCVLEWLNASDAIAKRLQEELYMFDVIVTDP